MCPLDPESTDGPYVWDNAHVRYDISEDLPGVPFEVNIKLVNSTDCEPISGAAVEIWHCDYRGELRALTSESFSPYLDKIHPARTVV